jgi:hypothetical protein
MLYIAGIVGFVLLISALSMTKNWKKEIWI